MDISISTGCTLKANGTFERYANFIGNGKHLYTVTAVSNLSGQIKSTGIKLHDTTEAHEFTEEELIQTGLQAMGLLTGRSGV